LIYKIYPLLLKYYIFVILKNKSLIIEVFYFYLYICSTLLNYKPL